MVFVTLHHTDMDLSITISFVFSIWWSTPDPVHQNRNELLILINSVYSWLRCGHGMVCLWYRSGKQEWTALEPSSHAISVLVKHFWWGPDLGHNNFAILKAIIEHKIFLKKQPFDELQRKSKGPSILPCGTPVSQRTVSSKIFCLTAQLKISYYLPFQKMKDFGAVHNQKTCSPWQNAFLVKEKKKVQKDKDISNDWLRMFLRNI